MTGIEQILVCAIFQCVTVHKYFKEEDIVGYYGQYESESRDTEWGRVNRIKTDKGWKPCSILDK